MLTGGATTGCVDQSQANMKQLRRAQSPPASRHGNAPPPPVLFDDLVVEILSRVPVKSLVRFKRVCKSWKSLISTPSFVKLHLHRSTTNADLDHLRLITKVHLRYLDECYAESCSARSILHIPSSTIAERLCYQIKDKYAFIGSCNGLLCVVCDTLRDGLEEYSVRLWNMATRLRSKKSPRLKVDWLRFSKTKFGFGYDHVRDTYKVVAVFLDRSSSKEDSQKTVVKVLYSMGDNSWRNIQSFPAVPSRSNDDGVYLSGTLNWLAVCNSSIFEYNRNTTTNDLLVMVSLDLGKETCIKLLLPHGLDDQVTYVEPTLGVLRDSLCVWHDYKKTHFVIWQMKEFGLEKSWSQLVSISYLDPRIGCLEWDSLLPLCMSKNGDVMMVSYSTYDGWLAILYNWRDNKLEFSKILSNINWIHLHHKVYVESLVIPC